MRRKILFSIALIAGSIIMSLHLNVVKGSLDNTPLTSVFKQASAQVENPEGSCNAWCKSGNTCTLRFVNGSTLVCFGKTPDGW